jgi:hypothetical protein
MEVHAQHMVDALRKYDNVLTDENPDGIAPVSR